ncbi:MAG: hypothetical protein PHQ34_16015 [Methanothrix sp.]|nr:hypothetical protein [Methanothrix sp.]
MNNSDHGHIGQKGELIDVAEHRQGGLTREESGIGERMGERSRFA